MNYQETLQAALELQLAGEDVEDFLSRVPDWRPEIEADLRLAALAKEQLSKVEPRPESAERAAGRLMITVQGLSRKHAARRWLLTFGRRFRSPSRLMFGAVLTAAVMLLIGLIVVLPDNNSPAATTAEAVVIEGTVFEISPAGLLLTSGTSQETVLIVEGAVLRDSLGNIVSAEQLKPGQAVILTGSHSNGDFLASKVELKGKLFGTVLNVDGELIRLIIGATEFTVVISPDTRVEGLLVAGVFVEIEVGELADGTLFAKAIEVEGAGDDDGASPNPNNQGDGTGSDGDTVTPQLSVGTSTRELGTTPNPEETEEPKETPTPRKTEEPGETATPGQTETPTPGETEGPEETPTPGQTEEPEETPTPGETEEPEETQQPTETPSPTEEPE